MPETAARGRQGSSYYDHGDQIIQRHLSAVEGALEIPDQEHYCGKHMFRPGTCFLSTPQALSEIGRRNHLQKLEKEDPTQAPVVLTRRVNIQSAGTFKYNYGEVDIRRMPILRSSKFLMIDGAGGNYVDMSLDDPNLHPGSTEVPLASNFGQVFLATLYGIPLRCKLKLLKTSSDESKQAPAHQISFILPNGLKMTKEELTMICMAWEIADEIYSCSGSANRMRELAQDVEVSTAAYVTNGRVILRGLELISQEAKLRKKKVNNALVLTRAISEINRPC